MCSHKKRGSGKEKKEDFLWRAGTGSAVFFIIFTFLAIPLEPAFAQSSTASDTTNPASTSIPVSSPTDTSETTSLSNPTSAPLDTTSGGTPTDQAPLTAKSAASPTDENKASNPATPSAATPASSQTSQLTSSPSTGPDLQPLVYNSFNQDQVKIDKNTGALNTTFPIDIPPGRNGLQPNLDLVYNSQNSQQGNIFGEGWSISIPYVERLNKTGVDQLYSTSTLNYFTSSLDGELVATTTVTSTASSYVARIENGTFNQYAFSSSSDQWTMTDKNGMQYVFGSTSDSQQSDPNNAAHVYKWMLKQVTDTNGNSILYYYFNDSGQIYPSSTVYTNTSSTTGIFSVNFLRASSTDNATSTATGFAVNSNYRVSEIDVNVSSTWVRKYVLNYTTGDNGYTTLLHSVTESGENASGTAVTEPTSTFTYQTQTPGWTSSSTWNPPVSFVSNGGVDNGYRLADLLGNGLEDIISSSSAYLNGTSSWVSSSTWNAPVSFTTSGGGDNGYRVVDVNNNGRDDIISCSGSYINTGSGWVSSSSWNSPICFANSGVPTGAILADVNGDGLPAILSGYTNASGTNVYGSWTNNNSIRADILTGVSYPQGGSASIAYNSASQFMNASGVPVNTEPYPVYVVSKITNNDGLGNLSSSTYQYANGTYYYGSPTDHEFAGFGLVTQTDPAGNVTKTYYDTSNGTNSAQGQYNDNFWKIGKAYRIENYDNAGNLYKVTITKWDSASTGVNSTFVFPDQTLEMDYDGLSTHEDSVESYTWNTANGNETQKVRWGQVTGSNDGTFVPLASGPKVFQVNTQSGGSLTNNLISYYPMEGNSNDYNNSNNGTDTSMSYGSTYGKVNEGASFNGTSSYISITSASGIPTGSSARSVALWMKTSINNATMGLFRMGAGGSGQFFLLVNNSGHDYLSTANTDLSGTKLIADGNWHFFVATYDGTTSKLYVDGALDVSGTPTVNSSGTAVRFGEDMDGSIKFNGDMDEVGVWTKVLSANEMTDLYDAGMGQTMTATPAGLNQYITNISYASSAGSAVTGKVSDETMENGSSTKIEESQYYYDGLGLGNIGAGNLTTQDDWASGSMYATTTRNTYNGYGLATQTLDPRNNTTTYSYDSYNLYPATTTNALGQATGYQYDYSTGKPTQTIDPNGLIFQTTYDGLGRPLQIFQPDQVTTSTEDLKTAYTYTDTSGAVSVHEADYLNGSTTVDTYRYYDGLNRLIQARKSATDAGIYKVTDQSYNSVGLKAKQSLPYFGSGASSTAATTTALLFTTYAYDPLGRVLTVANAVGTTTDVYSNWETKITDPNGNEKDVFHDAFGNLVQVGEHNGSSTYTTSYTYDGLQDILGLNDANGNVRSFAYDGLGREASSTDLHTPASSTYGIWNYTYDNAGNLTKRVDPKNQTVTYAYDALNRVSTESYASTTQVAYTYDTCTNGIGRLCSVSSTAAVSLDAKTYDPGGNLASETKTINGTNYGTSYTYDRQGNQLTITNPDGSAVAYTYGTGGLVTNVQEKESGGGFANIVSSIDYSPTDKVATQTDANGAATVNTYDPTKLYRLSSMVTTTGGSTHIQSSTYAYDNNGNITQAIDSSATNGAITVNYTYDGLNRLLTASSSNASSGGNYLQTFTYDPVGNILSGPAGTYTYGGGSAYTDPDAVTKITNGTSTTFAYDNNGNLTNASSGFTYAWDYNNRLMNVYGAGATSTYGYDYAGERASVTNGTSTIYYPETTYNVNGTSTITKNIYANGELVATIQNGTSTVMSYVSSDYIGSTNAVSNSSGALVENINYLPFGALRIDNMAGVNMPQKYIGQLHDASTGLNYLNARYQNPAQGQFISEDPMFLGNQSQQNLSDPQSLNAYSYSEDNPIVHSDSTGKQLDPVDVFNGLSSDATQLAEYGQAALDAFENLTPSEAAQATLQATNESTQVVDPILDLSKNPKWIEIIGQPEKYGLDTAPILNGPEGFMAPNLSSPFLQISAPIVSTIAIGNIAYRSSQGVTDQEDLNPPTVPHISSQPSTNNGSNGRSTSASSQNSGGGGISQSELTNLNSILNQLTAILNQLQSIVSSRNTSSGSSKK
jgi:RHS repeat-associated protein